jgi:mRNA interferase MazF
LVEPYCPDSGDFIWINFDPQAGHEQAGHRPAIVLSPRSFNRRVSLAFICPITSKRKDYPFEVMLPPHPRLKGVVLCEHLRSLDWQARKATFIGKAPENLLIEIRDVVAAIAGIDFE